MDRTWHDCDRIRDRLMDLIEDELGAEEHRQIRAHLSLCPQCARDAHALRATLARLRTLPEPTVPAGLLDGFAAAVQRRIAEEAPPRLSLWRKAAAWLGAFSSLRPIPALSAAAVLGLLLAIGLLRTPHLPPSAPVPEIVVVGESLSIAQNLDVLEQFDVLEELDVLEQLPLLRSPDNGRAPRLS
jgi:anti-sigma factor RsiW